MKPSTALLVIDIQVGAFDAKLIPAIDGAAELLIRIAALVDAARCAGSHVIFVQHCAPEGELLAEGTKGWEMHPSVSPTDGETVIRKHQSSAFESTKLRQILEERDIDTVISCGLQSEQCITNTSISALELGLDVIVAEDGHSTWTTDLDEASAIVERQNTLLRHRGARIEPIRALVQWLSNP